MDGTAAISHNLEALKRILAGLFAMAGLGDGQSAIGSRQSEAIADDHTANSDCRLPNADCRLTLPRHLRLAILRLLRPAESAARRLIIASASGLVMILPPPRNRKPKPATAEPVLRRFGIAVVMSPAGVASAAILPRSRGRGTVLSLSKGGGGGGPRTMPLSLFDPLRRVRTRRRHIPTHAAPRILFPGSTVDPHPEVPASGGPRRADDPIDATRLTLRLAALAAALDDLPGQAKRFARWRALKARPPGRTRRISPLRPGRPPGGRLTRFDPSATHPRNIRDVDEILAHAHALAVYALERPDTS